MGNKKGRAKKKDLILTQIPRKNPSDSPSLGPLNLPDGSSGGIDLASGVDLASVPVSRMEANKRARDILEYGKVSFSRHARTQMGDRRMDTNDVLCILRGGHVNDEGELEGGTVRYRMETSRMVVVFAFRGPDELVVVTAWRES